MEAAHFEPREILRGVAHGNLEIVRSMYDAWNEGDIDAFLARMDPGIKIDYRAGIFPGIDDTYEGHDGALRYWGDLREPWSSLRLEVEEIRERDDKVATLFTFEGKGREGIVVRRRLGNVMTLRDGMVVRFDAYGDPRAALEAAGLSE